MMDDVPKSFQKAFQDFPDLDKFAKDFDLSFRQDCLFATAEKIDYEHCLFWQKHCLEFIRHHKKLKIFFLVTHPCVLTMGRGLQRATGGKVLEGLVEQEDLSAPFPVHTIKRGGGLTFHHPGQLICYPILSLDHASLKSVTEKLLAWSEKLVKKFCPQLQVIGKMNPLGLWFGAYKIASIGIGVEHFVTYHGLALNVFYNQEMFSWLQQAYPCGLSGGTYRALESLFSAEDTLPSWQKIAQIFQEIILEDLPNRADV